ncbi:unnamed protein product, partial [Adineta steineri]
KRKTKPSNRPELIIAQYKHAGIVVLLSVGTYR